MRIGLLECDHVDDRYRSIGGDYFDMFASLLPAADLVRYDTIEGKLPAAPDECATAQVTLRSEGRKLRVWIHEGPSREERKGMRTVSVHVAQGAASLRVPLDPPASARLRPVDGRTGHPIPRPTTPTR